MCADMATRMELIKISFADWDMHELLHLDTLFSVLSMTIRTLLFSFFLAPLPRYSPIDSLDETPRVLLMMCLNLVGLFGLKTIYDSSRFNLHLTEVVKSLFKIMAVAGLCLS